MKNNYLIMLSSVIILSCSGGVKTDMSDLPIVNSVEEINKEKATSLPLTDDNSFLISGKVSGNLYILGKGVIELVDTKNDNEKMYVASKNKYKIGESITIKVSKQPIITINDDGIDVFVEL
ncbi:hypothetical protein [Lacihabitans soyangensis]|uniref:Uncharacterized protein n=1 Tax=Lacihabitans soyangensis TaxID=869394 RepID=A0AAE3KRK5_9BACT|nr:hypothetical protein [Lacihabitans soyangensis]MCP9762307.1 hypothetical protein [Lacihabitans soyangensis]